MGARTRRLVFGEVAELYDASRPTYPEAIIDDLAAWAADGDGPPRALEVGAGTGKATRLLTQRGVAVLAIEPSPEMAAIARRSTAASGRVEVRESDFEHTELGGRTFPLVYAAQAWHWVTQPAGYARARAALRGGGRLVAFWNRPVWGRSAIRTALDAAYDRYAADMPPGIARPIDRFDADEDWVSEIAAADGFAEPEVRGYDWSLRYTPAEYVDLITTHSEIRLLADDRRAALLAAVGEAITANGGVLELPMHVRACIARAH